MRLGRFYPILDLDLALARGHDPVALARGLAELGIALLQLRAKRLSARDFCAQARAIVAALAAAPRPEVGIPEVIVPEVIINDRADIALLSGAQGLHLGQDDLPLAAARRLLPASATIGLSTHSVAQVERVLGESWISGVPSRAARPVQRGSYLAFGPIFPTAGKDRPDPVTGLAALREVRRIYAGPLVAIGGITLENCSSVWEAGADAVAVIGGWLGAPAPLAAAARWMAAARAAGPLP
ncbi:MAG: thiamine phosphate synthase [Terriglobales bacterium]